MHRYRSHTCGALRESHIGETVRLSGWCHVIRDHGGVLFIDLRDHYGITQCVADPDSPAFNAAEKLRLEWVVRIAHERIDRAAETGDEAHTGPVLHWAHILKIEQGPNGDWPTLINARTGAAVGADRTRVPAGLMARLDALHDSTEFEAAIALAERVRNYILKGE